ncbi:hypothetical protein GCM10011391_35370 [Pullulanibacillus camelliae]|uniref:Site-specific DNA-methyltransferase n=1 Tax=Pullulanibacillus camelliae TaxID=1707096 RepID=A0A8J2YMK2_9BACL|nr:site-specific DNA-methyltransferase [Pullulanibacillus camelliae]GGE53413.1 hypothetical protein GCM10011391_35370 [Pullulanibacillus camelliae]
MIKETLEKNEYGKLNDKKMNVLKQHFPNCFVGETFDIEKFKNEIKQNIDFSSEGYELNFLGKNYAKYIADSIDTETVLIPNEEHNSKEENKNSSNIYITGDNLDVLKHLRKSYSDQVNLIYVDPNYNTDSDDFVYSDSFSFTKEQLINVLGIEEAEAERILNMTSSNSSSHSAWMTFMYPRLFLGRELLKDDGLIFISIGKEELDNLLKLADDIFGENNRVGIVSRVTKTASNNGTYFAPTVDYVICFAKNIDKVSGFTDIVNEKLYKKIEKSGPRKGERYRDDVALYQASLNDLRPNQKYFIECPDGSKVIPPCSILDEVMREGDGRWRWTKDTYLKNKDLLVFKKSNRSPLLDENGNQAKYNIYTKSYLKDREESGTLPRELWTDFINRKGADLLKKMDIPFDFSKPVELIKYIIDITKTDNDSLILDFFSGSGTTAHAVLEKNAEDGHNRRYIMAQLDEKVKEKSEAKKKGYKTIDEIGRERIIRAAKMIKEKYETEIDYGFKHFTVKQLDENQIDKIKEFDPNLIAADFNVEFDKKTILTTWLNNDGHGLTPSYKEIVFNGYIGYYANNYLYLLDEGLSQEHIDALLSEIVENKEFNPTNIIIYGYNFMEFNILTQLELNLKQLRNEEKNIEVSLIKRY